MSMQITGRERVFQFNSHLWSGLLKFAKENGWEPLGVRINTDMAILRCYSDDRTPEENDRVLGRTIRAMAADKCGTYSANGSYSWICAEDAREMGAALRRGLERQTFIDEESAEFQKSAAALAAECELGALCLN